MTSVTWSVPIVTRQASGCLATSTRSRCVSWFLSRRLRGGSTPWERARVGKSIRKYQETRK
jgi:hypothetical protein